MEICQKTLLVFLARGQRALLKAAAYHGPGLRPLNATCPRRTKNDDFWTVAPKCVAIFWDPTSGPFFLQNRPN